ncbi:MAG: hypothetical protein QOG41_1440 [Thermoleophilaceae bacterium]|nr:hypothetical protein [Thermoleophilaceae bacterium]
MLPGAIAVMSFTALAFLSLPALLIAVTLLVLLRASAVEMLLGFFAGAGVTALVIGLGASGDRVCPHRAVVTAAPSFECVADRWWPSWIAFGAGLFALAVLAYAAVRMLEKCGRRAVIRARTTAPPQR